MTAKLFLEYFLCVFENGNKMILSFEIRIAVTLEDLLIDVAIAADTITSLYGDILCALDGMPSLVWK